VCEPFPEAPSTVASATPTPPFSSSPGTTRPSHAGLFTGLSIVWVGGETATYLFFLGRFDSGVEELIQVRGGELPPDIVNASPPSAFPPRRSTLFAEQHLPRLPDKTAGF